MLDTLRARLTLWYSVVLALLLLLFSLTSYFLFSRAANHRTDAELAELGSSFLVTLQDELKDPDKSGGLQAAARQAMLEHHVRGDILLIVGAEGEIAASSMDLMPSSAPVNSIASRALASSGVRNFVATASQPERSYGGPSPRRRAAFAHMPRIFPRTDGPGRS